ncbi:2'-5' RNA ligase family protein [Micromonospora sp. LOL_021]|uniref:2'-5' RNA ligase family protein n=1 Tax=Micromonospora sp. LOL_021 TaxID=3345417 RepID=UPI003A8615CB
MVGHVPSLTAIAAYCQDRRRDLPHLGLVPTASLHITIQRLAFTDEVSLDVAAEVVDHVRRRCVDLRTVPVEVGPLAGSPEAVRFSAGPPEPVRGLRDLIRESIRRGAQGRRPYPDGAGGFVPHVSIAYHDSSADTQSLIQRVASLRYLHPVTATIQSADVVELRREGQRRWAMILLAERVAAFATLFQGTVALPTALALPALIGAIGQERPVADGITQLSVLIGTSQLLGLPFLIYLTAKQQYTLVPFAFAAITSMHFVLYSWLHQTPVYIGMAVLISLGTTTVMFTAPGNSRRTRPVAVSFLTGGLLLSTALLFLILHLAIN